MARTLLVDVDTQIDFMRPTGALYVPGAEALEDNLARLVLAARRAGIKHLATADAHTPDDPEFQAFNFPPHCVVNTPGQARIAATRQVAPVVLADAAAVTDATLAGQELTFPKVTFDVFDNPAFAQALAALAPERAIVCGVATDYCVKAAVLGLLKRQVAVWLVEDAIAAVDPAAGEKTLTELVALGARRVDTATALAAIEQGAAHVARR